MSSKQPQNQGSGLNERDVDVERELTKTRSELVWVHDLVTRMEAQIAALQVAMTVREIREEATEKATLLQAKEYERRLEALNHENARIQAAADTFMPREVYDANESGINKWRAEISVTLTELKVAVVEISTLRERVDSVMERVSTVEKANIAVIAKGGGSVAAVDWLFRGIAVLATIVGLYLLISGR